MPTTGADIAIMKCLAGNGCFDIVKDRRLWLFSRFESMKLKKKTTYCTEYYGIRCNLWVFPVTIHDSSLIRHN